MNENVDLRKPIHLNEWAYNAIKTRIIEHQVKPGCQLKIDELSSELGISRTPIREALLRLKQDGLVLASSRVGFFVRGITKEDFKDIFELRRIIEAYAAEKIADYISDEEIRVLDDIHEHCKAMVEQGDNKAFNQYEVKLHNTILDRLNNKKIRSIMDSVGDILHRLRIYALDSDENIKQSLLEHEKIIQAIKDRDCERARQSMEEHIDNVENRLKEYVDFQD